MASRLEQPSPARIGHPAEEVLLMTGGISSEATASSTAPWGRPPSSIGGPDERVQMGILIGAMPFAGHATPVRAVARTLVARGHEVLADTGQRYGDGFVAVGAELATWRRAPDFDDRDPAATFPPDERRDLPPSGLALAPAVGRAGRVRDAALRRGSGLALRRLDRVLAEVRSSLGLPPPEVTALHAF